jgi:hypothetical protein
MLSLKNLSEDFDSGDLMQGIRFCPGDTEAADLWTTLCSITLEEYLNLFTPFAISFDFRYQKRNT